MTRYIVRISPILLALLSVACGYDNDDRVREQPKDQIQIAYGTIETGATMQDVETGAGVFVEYATGGNWKMQVGCDTAKTDMN